jgi:hypothetical protein
MNEHPDILSFHKLTQKSGTKMAPLDGGWWIWTMGNQNSTNGPPSRIFFNKNRQCKPMYISFLKAFPALQLN